MLALTQRYKNSLVVYHLSSYYVPTKTYFLKIVVDFIYSGLRIKEAKDNGSND